jgi:protein-S-isoprenylcysteine O-methyltransferase Ste14
MNAKSRSLGALVLLIGAALLLVQRHEIATRTGTGLALQGIAVLLMIWARLTFGMRSFHATANPTEGGLVTNGPYRYWRHPIYAAVLLFVWTGVLTQGGPPAVDALVLAGIATVMTAIRIQAEEQLLLASMPEYAAYAARTKRLVPFVF